jgi:hypothetical protein
MLFLTATTASWAAPASVTLDYPAGGGSRATIRGTTDRVDVRSTTGVIDVTDPDLVKALDCKKPGVVVCDPAAFNPNPKADQTSVCTCVRPKPPITPGGSAAPSEPAL